MVNVYYAKVRSYSVSSDSVVVEELFLQAGNYADAAKKIEKYYEADLISFQLFAYENSMLFVSDIKEYLDEARSAFKE